MRNMNIADSLDITEEAMRRAALRIRAKYGLKVQAAHQSFEAVNSSYARASHSFIPKATDARKELDHFTRIQLLKFGRYFYNNNDLVKGAIDDMARYSVGSGFIAQAQTQNIEWNLEAENYWKEWSQRCDVRGLMTFSQLLYLWCLDIDRDGETFILLSEDEKGEDKLQTIRAHSISPGSFKAPLFDGVFQDALGRPLAYRVIKDSLTLTFQDIPATATLHLFEPRSSDQIRGIPCIAASMNNLRDLVEIYGFEKIAVKLNSVVAAVITRPPSDEDPGLQGYLGNLKVEGGLTLEQVIAGGVIPELPPGADFKTWASDRPNSSLPVFAETFIRGFCASIGLPYEFVWNSSALGGAPYRGILAKAQRRFEQRQSLLIEKACNRVWAYVIAKAIQRKQLPPNEEFLKVNWQTPKAITVDAGREAGQDREDIKMGLRTLADHYGEQGYDWQEKIEQIGKEAAFIQATADKHSVPVQMIQMLTPNANEKTDQQENKGQQPENKNEISRSTD